MEQGAEILEKQLIVIAEKLFSTSVGNMSDRDLAIQRQHNFVRKGYAVCDKVPDNEEVKSERIEPLMSEGDHEIGGWLVYHPGKAEVIKFKWLIREQARPEEADGWELIDSNIARGIFARTLPQ